MKLYFHISSSGEWRKIIVKGRVSIERCQERWEEIIQKSCERTGNFDYANVLEVRKSLGFLLREQQIVKAAILRLFISYNEAAYIALKKRKFIVDTSSDKRYFDSLQLAIRRVNVYTTKIISKQNELNELTSNTGGHVSSFDEVMANLYSGLGFVVQEDITLARYNELIKVIKKRNGRNRELDLNKR